MTASYSEVASEGASWFEMASRDDGGTYIRLKPGEPEWVKDLVFKAHENGRVLPSDDIYEIVWSALGFIADQGYSDEMSMDDGAMDFADNHADCNYVDLINWLSRDPVNHGEYCNAAFDEYGKRDTLWDTMSLGQYLQARDIYNCVSSAVQEDFNAR